MNLPETAAETSFGELNAAEISAFVIETTMSGVESIDDDTALFSSGIIDSMGVIALVEFIETHTGRKIKPTEITLENFDSVNSILRFISS